MNITGHNTSTVSKEQFLRAIDREGFIILKDIFKQPLLQELKDELLIAINKEAAYHGDTEYKDYGMLLACPVYGGAFLKVADSHALMEPFNWTLGDTSIMYVYTSSSMPPSKGNYSSRIHVDRPHFIPEYIEALGCLILLDDFTEENGATWMLPGSHKTEDAPEEALFYANAVRIIAPAGSVVYFNLRIWHAGGINHSGKWRHSLGIGMVRGYLKQRIDLPRAMKHVDTSMISDYGLQKLGYFSQPPASLDEYYTTPEKRTYKQRSEWEET